MNLNKLIDVLESVDKEKYGNKEVSILTEINCETHDLIARYDKEYDVIVIGHPDYDEE